MKRKLGVLMVAAMLVTVTGSAWGVALWRDHARAQSKPAPHSVRLLDTSSEVVTACGTGFCLAGQPWRLAGAAMYHGLADPKATVHQAQAMGLNTLRLTDYLPLGQHASEAVADENSWRRVDLLLAEAHAFGLKVVFDLSSYRNLLEQDGLDPYTEDWDPFLQRVMERTNSQSGRMYRDDPTIAYVELAGEVDLKDAKSIALGVTTQQVTDFYRRTLTQLSQVDSQHLHSAGGMSHLETSGGVDWRTIMSLPGNDICAVHNYSQRDSLVVTPLVASYCAGLSKPWLTEEFGLVQGMGDDSRAAAFASMFALQRLHHAAGVAFWNLGEEIGSQSYDVNLATPKTYEAVHRECTWTK